jgi:hypothetical protein
MRKRFIYITLEAFLFSVGSFFFALRQKPLHYRTARATNAPSNPPTIGSIIGTVNPYLQSELPLPVIGRDA